jgi:hypothetical protein
VRLCDPVRRFLLAPGPEAGGHQHRTVGAGGVVFQGNIVAYQHYVVNHEVGHALGFDHRGCATDGDLAPVMMQQTWGTSNDYLASLGTDSVAADGKSCQANPWPFPRAAG